MNAVGWYFIISWAFVALLHVLVIGREELVKYTSVKALLYILMAAFDTWLVVKYGAGPA